MLSNETEPKSEIRARARTSSSDLDTMNTEIIQAIPTLPLQIPEMVVIGAEPKMKKLSMVQILLLNAVVCGVEICACAGFTYIPPMLLKVGYTEENMSIILGLGPLIGFFLVPVLGRASDRCRSSLGRRRPFILWLSFLLLISLLLIPYSDKICSHIIGPGPLAKSFGILLLTLAVILLDFTSQACLNPCEALLSDASKDTDQYERVFIVYSLMVSLGGFIGYLITAIDWNYTSIGSIFKSQERTVFTMLMILFSILLLATMFAAKETPFAGQDVEVMDNSLPKATDTLIEVSSNSGESGYDTNGSENGNILMDSSVEKSQNVALNLSPSRTRSNLLLTIPKVCLKNLLTCKVFSALLNLLRLIWINILEKLPEPFQKLCDIPYVLRHLTLAHFCSWTAVMGFNLFFTDFVGNAVYAGNANAPEDSYLRNRFDEGVRMGSWGLLLHCITSAVYALFIERLVSRYGCKLTYTFGMTSFIFAMFGMVLFKNVIFVNLMACLTGIAYATVTTIPYILVSKYHNEKEIYFADVHHPRSGIVPVRGIATDMAMLDSAYFLSQVVLSCIMGYIVYMTGSVLSYMATAGVMGIFSLYFIQNIITCKQELTGYNKLEVFE